MDSEEPNLFAYVKPQHQHKSPEQIESEIHHRMQRIGACYFSRYPTRGMMMCVEIDVRLLLMDYFNSRKIINHVDVILRQVENDVYIGLARRNKGQ